MIGFQWLLWNWFLRIYLEDFLWLRCFIIFVITISLISNWFIIFVNISCVLFLISIIYKLFGFQWLSWKYNLEYILWIFFIWYVLLFLLIYFVNILENFLIIHYSIIYRLFGFQWLLWNWYLRIYLEDFLWIWCFIIFVITISLISNWFVIP